MGTVYTVAQLHTYLVNNRCLYIFYLLFVCVCVCVCVFGWSMVCTQLGGDLCVCLCLFVCVRARLCVCV